MKQLNLDGIAVIHRFIKDNALSSLRTWEFLNKAELLGAGNKLMLSEKQTKNKQLSILELTAAMFKENNF